MPKKDNSKVIMTHVDSRVSSFKKGESKDMAKGPRKLAKQEIENTSAKATRSK